MKKLLTLASAALVLSSSFAMAANTDQTATQPVLNSSVNTQEASNRNVVKREHRTEQDLYSHAYQYDSSDDNGRNADQ